MKKKSTIKKLILSAFMMMLSFNVMSANINASTDTPSTIFMLSDELIDAGYRMQGCTQEALQCFSENGRVIGVELKLASDQRVVGFPAINNGKDYRTLDVEFRVENTVVSNARYSDADSQYHPTPINYGTKWNDGTTFTAYFRDITVNYYDDDSTYLTSEMIHAGETAKATASEKTEDDSAIYTFDKWTNQDGSEAVLTDIRLSLNVYASYTATSKFDVEFMNNGSTIFNTKVVDGNYATYNDIPTKDETVREDLTNIYTTSYTFSHWNVNGNQVALDSYEIHDNTVFEAVYQESETTTKKVLAVPGESVTPSNPTTPILQTTNSTFTTNPSVLNTNPVTNETIETVNDNPTPLANNAQVETANDNETPLAQPIETTTWSLINLIFMLLTIAFGISYLRNKQKKHNIWLSMITLATSIVIFVTTQDLTAAMGYFDQWTIVMAILMIIAAIQVKNKQQANN